MPPDTGSLAMTLARCLATGSVAVGAALGASMASAQATASGAPNPGAATATGAAGANNGAVAPNAGVAKAVAAPSSDTPRPAALTRQAVRIVSAGRTLSDWQRVIEQALGLRLVLSPQAGDAVVQGEVSGSDGLAFIRELAARLRLDWAFGREEVFLAPEGSTAKPVVFNTPSASVASAVAALANQEFESQGSAIRFVARKEEVLVTGIAGWISQVAALRMPALIEQAQRGDGGREGRRGLAAGRPDNSDDPMVLQVFQLNNAFVDDKRLSVGSSTLLIPGVARLFRQFTGMSGGATDSVRPSGVADAALARSERIEPVAGGRPARAEAERAETPPRSNERTLSRTERLELAQDELDLAAARAEQAANLPAAIADSRMNALVVRDRSSRMAQHRSLVEVLDKPAEMVQLDAFVIDIKASRLAEFGLGLSWAGSTGANSPRFNPGAVNPGNNANVILQGVRGAQLLANIRALESTGDTEMLTVPSVVTLNNLEATFSARENFFVRVAGNQDASLNRVTAETLLKVTPLVSGNPGSGQDRRIRLLISVQDGSVDGSVGAVVDTLPRTLENQISTQAVVKGGDTLVIGGQVVRKRINSLSGLPILGSIPLLGHLTNTRSTEVAQFVRLYVVRPRLLGEDSSTAGPGPSLPDDELFSPVKRGVMAPIDATSARPKPLLPAHLDPAQADGR